MAGNKCSMCGAVTLAEWTTEFECVKEARTAGCRGPLAVVQDDLYVYMKSTEKRTASTVMKEFMDYVDYERRPRRGQVLVRASIMEGTDRVVDAYQRVVDVGPKRYLGPLPNLD